MSQYNRPEEEGTPRVNAGVGGEFSHKRSLIRRERVRIDPSHPQYHYAQVTAQQSSHLHVQPSATGLNPILQEVPMTDLQRDVISEESGSPISDTDLKKAAPGYAHPDNAYDSQLALPEAGEEEKNVYGPPAPMVEDPIQPLTRAVSHRTAKRKQPERLSDEEPSLWRTYCRIITFFFPGALLNQLGMKTKERQMAWREKIGLISVICYIGAFVAYLTFGFTATVCKNGVIRIRNSEVSPEFLIINGRAYDMLHFKHPAAEGIPAGSSVLYPPLDGAGMDASFLFQNVNGYCKDVITPKENCSIPHDGSNLAYYFPCRLFAPNGTTQPNFTTRYYEGYACHTPQAARNAYYSLKISGEVYFTWDDVRNSTRQLIVYNGNVLDLALLDWLRTDDVNYPAEFEQFRHDGSIRGVDVSHFMAEGDKARIIKCLSEIVKVGYVDSEEIGCIVSKVELYVALVVIVGMVGFKFLAACYFKFFIAGKQGAFYMDRKALNQHDRQIEDWSNDIYSQAPVKTVNTNNNNNRRSRFFNGLNKCNRDVKNRQSITMSSQFPSTSTSKLAPEGSIYGIGHPGSRSSFMMLNSMTNNSDPYKSGNGYMDADTSYQGAGMYANEEEHYDSHGVVEVRQPQYEEYYDTTPGNTSTAIDYVVPQPPVGYQPFGYPLAHTICLVTAYSESMEGLRTTLDSIATTDYPNSHKLIVIICDGLIRGSGNDMTTPEIALSMMKDFAEDPEEVHAYSYVSVVSGSKRHNMAKVYAGFYSYDDNTIDPSKQQRVPVMTIVKCGTPAEANQAKPGNRGKRDSQIILMSFFQKVMFDERMTELEYEIFNGIWKITGIAPDFYEMVLMVDADTKVFPDSLTHMVAEMVKDTEVISLCGETKIANKSESWVTMIQVFEYFISHHQAKAFESVFGSVTCLPGCFSLYRIKTPKGNDGYWVPILANPDIVERYSDNVVDTLHKKNLLLLGEDRFLSTLMLRTFPKRKQIFVPKAACKTVVPSEFKVLLSQRRRWINSTVHNLMDLVLVRDLCGVFCISMQFVVFIDVVSTLVLPAAITFTLYIVILSIISKPTPVLPLVLLALILGLPGVLIVITASRASYVMWMAIYLVALPIWNFVLPMNAYWKFDDFSWGDTRTIHGGDKGGHDDAEGEFDSSQIVMKRWRDFQRERKRAFISPSAAWAGSNSIVSGANSMTQEIVPPILHAQDGSTNNSIDLNGVPERSSSML